MKNRLNLLIMAGTLIAILSAKAVTLDLSPTSSSVNLGDSVQVELRISGLGVGSAPSLGAYDFTLAFNPAVLGFGAFTFGDPVLGNQLDLRGFGSISGFDGGTSGQLSAFEVSLDPVADLDALQASSFALGTVSFNALGNGVSALQFTSGVWSDATGNPLAVQFGSGSISVPEPVSGGVMVAAAMAVVVGFGMKSRRSRALPGKLLPLVLLLGLPGLAYGQFEYRVDGDTITITQYTGSGGDVVIPQEINGIPVTGIGEYAFAGSTTGVTRVTIPASVTHIGDEAFSFSLAPIEVDPGNPVYGSLDGDLLSKDQTTLIRCSGGKEGEYTVPDGVVEIADFAFQGCENLTSVTICDGVTTIGGWAFESCRGLASVTIPSSVTTISDRAFMYCTALRSVAIPDGVTAISDCTFFGCTGLLGVAIPASVTRIGEEAFAYCRSVTSVTIPHAVTRIDWGAFLECTSLTTISIPEGVTIIPGAAFARCTSLSGILIPDSVSRISEYAFEDCAALASVGIPDSVTDIGEFAFSNCGSLTSIAIPNSVTKIDILAFAGCTRLTTATLGARLTRIGSLAFSACASLTAAYFEGDAPEVEPLLWTGQPVRFSPFSETPVTIYYMPGTSGWGADYWGHPTVAIVLDSDGDGIADVDDCCPISDLSPTLAINGRDSRVPNTWFSDGCTISDQLAKIANNARNHGKFVSGVAQYLNELRRAGVITAAQLGAIQNCAARSAIP